MNFQSSILLLDFGLSLTILIISLRRSKNPGAIYLAVLSLVVSVWTSSYLLYRLRWGLFSPMLFTSINYLSSTVAATALLAFSLTYSNRSTSISRLTIFLFSIQPVLTQALFWVKPWREFFFLGQGLFTLNVRSGVGLWPEINAIYIYNFQLASILLLTDLFLKKPRALLLQSGSLLAGAFPPLVFGLLSVMNLSSPENADYSIAGYSMAIVGLAVGLYRQRLVEVKPITHESVIQGMDDGWMVLDLNNNILDINPAAEKILGVSRHGLYGKPIRSVLPDWLDISVASEDLKELEMRRSIRSHDNWRYFNVRLSNLKDKNGEPFGQLIVWRDITERKLSEDARQRARDEMFILLNAISNAASHSLNLNDFLTESIYQIIYPFQSQIVAIFLADESDHGKHPVMMHLASHFGLSLRGVESLKNINVAEPVFDMVFNTKQPLFFDSVPNDSQLSDLISELEIKSLVILPLLASLREDGRFLGCLLLARKMTNPYSQDDAIRLTAIAEQISNLIDNDQRRQLAIALSERERLLRDLHDSVSQKLYGLVALTEAAQAGIDAGSKVVPSQVLAKIGENARQAVKEMRLFLYEMQPVDLEQEGLVTILHHRLAAVEGRADIQARLLADEEISLSKEKEIALYFIAQEALNNILKHAHAKSVSITLKQTRNNVVLEISDDGQGFEPNKVERGGMGLQNMKARASQVNGKLQLTSHSGNGTRIKVTVGRDRLPIRSKDRK